ncbi:hypothetical protein FI667_g4723, partial [Globisporangium splendens]
MRTRIWEDDAAMKIVSVLGFLMNDDGEVVGPERTQVLCKLMPSIHTLTHRAILAMLIANLNDADAHMFYAENGLRVLNEWLVDGIRKKEPSMSKEKRRVEMFSQVRALLRILDVNVQTDAARKQNAYLCETIPRLIELLENAGSEYATEWSRINLYRRHFESTCGVPSTFKDTRHASSSNGSSTPSTSSNGTKPAAPPKPVAGSIIDASARNAFAAASVPLPVPISTATLDPKPTNTASSSAASSSTSTRISPSSLLEYQPKSFLQVDGGNKGDELIEYVDDDDEELLVGEQVITNVNQSNVNASLMLKIKGLGHVMQYGERMHCRFCRRMTAKRCERCSCCVKCVQKDRCNPAAIPAPIAKSAGGNLSVSDRNVQVLGSAMDQGIYKAFRQEDFHAVFSLVQNGMDVNFQRVESDMSSALMAAAHHGREDAVDKLLKLGADPTLKDCNGDAAWVFAKRRGHIELMEKLKKCADEWKDGK